MTILHYLRIWLTAARYSIMRTLMFRGDFCVGLGRIILDDGKYPDGFRYLRTHQISRWLEQI